MRYFDDDKVVVMTVTQKDLTETGCVLSDTEGLIDYGMSVGSVKVAVCMTEQRERSYKVSLRSMARTCRLSPARSEAADTSRLPAASLTVITKTSSRRLYVFRRATE